MMRIEAITNEDIMENQNIFLAVNEVYGNFYGDYYKLIEDGETKFIHRLYNGEMTQSAFIVMSLDEEKLVDLEMFNTDEEYKILRAGFLDYEVTYYGDDIVVYDRNSEITSSVKFIKRINGEDHDGYTGLILYSQYKEATDERCVLHYQQMYNSFNLIYENNTKVPFIYRIEKDVMTKRPKTRLYGTESIGIREKPDVFNIITIKEYGLLSFLMKGACKLQGSDKIKRCLRIYREYENGDSFTGFPFTKIYSVEEIESQIKDKNFNIEIPDYLIQLYNQEHKGMKRYEEIAGLIKELCSDVEKEQSMKLLLTRRAISNENEEN